MLFTSQKEIPAGLRITPQSVAIGPAGSVDQLIYSEFVAAA
jgi:hypothetical protein